MAWHGCVHACMFMVPVLTRPVEDLARHGVVLVLCNVICCHHHNVVWTVTASHQHLIGRATHGNDGRQNTKRERQCVCVRDMTLVMWLCNSARACTCAEAFLEEEFVRLHCSCHIARPHHTQCASTLDCTCHTDVAKTSLDGGCTGWMDSLYIQESQGVRRWWGSVKEERKQETLSASPSQDRDRRRYLVGMENVCLVAVIVPTTGASNQQSPVGAHIRILIQKVDGPVPFLLVVCCCQY
jgi:hypothetical protein